MRSSQVVLESLQLTSNKKIIFSFHNHAYEDENTYFLLKKKQYQDKEGVSYEGTPPVAIVIRFLATFMSLWISYIR